MNDALASQNSSREVLLETSNPLDVKPDELRELAQELNQGAPEIDFIVGYFDQHGSGVTWHEVLHVWLPSADFIKNTAWMYVMTILGKWGKKRFDKLKGGRRPKSIVFHDSETGKEVGKILLKDENDEVVLKITSESVLRNKPPIREVESGGSDEEPLG